MSHSLKRFAAAVTIAVSPFVFRIEASKAASFDLIDATVSDINSAFDSGTLTSEQLVNLYINRINTFDKAGSKPLNSIVTINPQAVETAKALDIERQTTGARSPLHGIPLIVKDNYDTFDLPTTGGSLSLAGSIPPDDAFQVRKLREAGAIVLAKSNMAEFAFSPNVTVSSILGTTRNPYDLDRVPAGSSGGTAAAVAANFGTLGLGTDTGNSIRGPSSHTALVGIRSTIGLTSRDGIVPLFLPRDIGGPMVRTVADAALVLSTIAGYDPADPSTEAVKGVDLPDYTAFLNAKGLEGSRIGVVDQLFRPTAENDFTSTADPEIRSLMDRAITDLAEQGATVESVGIPNLTDLYRASFDGGNTFNYDINRYLESRGPDVPVKTLDDIIESGLFDPSIEGALLNSAEVGDVPPESRDDFLAAEAARQNMREIVLSIMNSGEYDALIYPTWSNSPRLIGDLESPSGNNSFQIAPPTGFPALTVPMGFTVDDTLPAGLQFLGRPFDEGRLIELAYSYEQSTQYRRPPELFPALAGDKIESESIPEPGVELALVILGAGLIVAGTTKKKQVTVCND
ncbi:MAG: amidase family protein [Phormidesmis sp.]